MPSLDNTTPRILTKDTATAFCEARGIKTKDPKHYLWRQFNRDDRPWPHTRDGDRYWFVPAKIDATLTGEESEERDSLKLSA